MGISVLKDDAPVSTGNTASVPYVRRKGVSPVVECGVVRYDQSTLWSSSVHFPFASPNLLFRPRNITLFAASACPFV
ncbi:hypothetical protein A2U01_0068412, partial [Trifolium medium]|nr:hypothetical protein [Trifolium medium]